MPDRMKVTPLYRANPGAPERLDSWKEIAAYLGREPRTVRRWEEMEGLPIHRLQHGKGSSVYALRTELDEWVKHRSEEPSSRSAGGRRDKSRFGIIVAAAVALAAAGGLLYLLRAPEVGAGRPTTLTSDPGTELEARLSLDAAHVAYV